MGKSYRGPGKQAMKEKFLEFREKRKKRRVIEDDKESGHVRGNRNHTVMYDDDSEWDIT